VIEIKIIKILSTKTHSMPPKAAPVVQKAKAAPQEVAVQVKAAAKKSVSRSKSPVRSKSQAQKGKAAKHVEESKVAPAKRKQDRV
jgi:hypothetical protein